MIGKVLVLLLASLPLDRCFGVETSRPIGFIPTFTAFFLLSVQAFSQHSLSVRVLDSNTEQPIAFAAVIDAASGEVVTTDSQGEADFLSSFPGSQEIRLKIQAAGYGTQYREFISPGGGYAAHIFYEVFISSDNQFVSPPIGASGLTKAYSHHTNQMVALTDNDPAQTYLQDFSIQILPNTFSVARRIGFTAINESAWNNYKVQEELGSSAWISAQFEIQILDSLGQPIPSPAFFHPIRLEMDPGVVFFAGALSGLTAECYRFDEVDESWTTDGILGSGITPQGKLWVEIEKSSLFSIFLYEPVYSMGDCTTSTYNVDWAPSDGAPLSCEVLICPSSGPGGTQGSMSVDEEVELETSFSGDVAGELSGPLKLLGFYVTGNVGGSYTAKKRTKRKKDVSVGSFPGKKGKLCIRTYGLDVVVKEDCLINRDGQWLTLTTEISRTPVETGVIVNTSELTDCP